MRATKSQGQPFAREQRQIERQQDAMRVLELMVRHQNRTGPDDYSDGLAWTVEMLAFHLASMTEEEIGGALRWLYRRGYVEQGRGQWFTTKEGRSWLCDETKSVVLASGAAVSEFRNEALTGTDRDGHRSRLTWAALPSPVAVNNHENAVEASAINQCMLANKMRAIAAKLGLDLDETSEGIRTGRVRKCKGIEGVEPHWGVFHRANEKNGKRWQSLCVECRKKQRGKG